MSHLLRLTDLSDAEIYALLDQAAHFLQQPASDLQQPANSVLVANLFYEPSTRTRFSFETAEKRLGYQVLNFSSQTSSAKKGETLYDTVMTMKALGCQAVVIRHPEDGYYHQIEGIEDIAVLNAGDGAGDHPTQGLLDLLTLQQEFLLFEGLTVAIIGDLRYSRVARTDAEILTRLGAHVLLSGPEEWRNDALPGERVSVDEAITRADAVIMLRIQHERHTSAMPMTKEVYHQQYGLTLERAAQMKPESIIMHPGPINRGVEIDSAVVDGPQAVILPQVTFGIAVRMAVMSIVAGNEA